MCVFISTLHTQSWAFSTLEAVVNVVTLLKEVVEAFINWRYSSMLYTVLSNWVDIIYICESSDTAGAA